MRILFLTHYYPPEVNAPANRVHEHARVWVREGHEVTVLTGVPNHPRGALFPGYENRFQTETIDGVRVVRSWMYLTPNAGFVKRIANHLCFLVTAVLMSFRLEQPDVVVATSPQFFCGVAGALVAKLKRRPFVLEVRDLWPDSIVQLGQLRNPTIIRVLEAIERWLYGSASAVVVLTRAFARHVEAHGVPAERIELVYNGIDAEHFRPRPRDEALLAKHGLTGSFTMAYVGTLGLAHGLVQVLDAVARDFEIGPEFLASLKVAGAEGSKRRFQDDVCLRKMRVKTGHLYGVSALAGYGETVGGRRVVFAVLANEYRRGRAAADSGIEQICEAFLSFDAASAAAASGDRHNAARSVKPASFEKPPSGQPSTPSAGE